MLRQVVPNGHLHAGSSFAVNELAASIAELKRQLEDVSTRVSAQTTAGVSLNSVRGVVAARRRRRQFFDASLFADPAWDILLELYGMELAQERTCISKLSHAAGVPLTTALRWISKLEADGLIERQDDPLDARRDWLQLSKTGSAAMQAYLESCSGGPLPL
jgi:DNA-binding MarR family transcriptional regulator